MKLSVNILLHKTQNKNKLAIIIHVKNKKILKSIFNSFQRNLVITIIVLVLFIVGIIVFFKLIIGKKETVYARVKVSQGLWWANTLKPSYWMVSSIKDGDTEMNLTGKPVVEVLEVRSYPVNYNPQGQYDIYLNLKMHVDKNNNIGEYMYKRTPLKIGSAVDFQFTKVAISGTVIELSDKPISYVREKKIISIKKREMKLSDYESIQIGESYFDGEETILKILDKSYSDSYANYAGVNFPIQTEKPIDIDLTLEVDLRNQNGVYFYNDIPMKIGRYLYLETATNVLDNYTLIGIR